MNHEREDKGLLKDRVGENFLLDGDFDLDSSRMRFGPHERGVDKSDLL